MIDMLEGPNGAGEYELAHRGDGFCCTREDLLDLVQRAVVLLAANAPGARAVEAERTAAEQAVHEVRAHYDESIFAPPMVSQNAPDCYTAAGARLACDEILRRLASGGEEQRTEENGWCGGCRRKMATVCEGCGCRQCEDCGARSVHNPETNKFEYRCWDCRIGM